MRGEREIHKGSSKLNIDSSYAKLIERKNELANTFIDLPQELRSTSAGKKIAREFKEINDKLKKR